MEFTAKQSEVRGIIGEWSAGAGMEFSGAREHVSIHVETALERLASRIIQRDGDNAEEVPGNAGSSKLSDGYPRYAGKIGSGDEISRNAEMGSKPGNEILNDARDSNPGNEIKNDAGGSKVIDEETEPASTISSEIAQVIQNVTTEIKAADHVHKEKTREATKKKPSLLNDMLYLVLKLSAIALIFTLLLTFLFGIIRYQEPSMTPAIRDGDLVVFYRNTSHGYRPRDVVAMDYNGKRQVRRVVATAGDIVDITEEGLMINGALQQELEIYQNTERYQDGVSFPLTVPEGQVFMLSDSRINATDSRIYGSVEIKDTLGKVITVIRRRSI